MCRRFVLCMVLSIALVSCVASPTPLPTPTRDSLPTPTPAATVDAAEQVVQAMRERADIKLEDNGRVFTYTITGRFEVFLDDVQYPVDEIKCVPEGIIGSFSNGSLRGPHLYPIGFEGIQTGTCVLQNRDFHVQVVVDPRAWMIENADITLQQAGQTFTTTVMSLFIVSLDDATHPVSDLFCAPEGTIEHTTRIHFLDLDRYPIAFEAVREGTCVLQDRDFWAQIVITGR